MKNFIKITRGLCLLFLSFALLSSFNPCLASNAVINNQPTKKQIILIEYFDYTCPHCRRMQPVLDELLKRNINLKIIQRPVPVLHSDSWFIASIVLAAKQQDKACLLHQYIMHQQKMPSPMQVIQLAKTLGLNLQKLQQTIQLSQIKQIIKHNITLAESYAKHGVLYLPMIVIDNNQIDQPFIVLTGEQPYTTLQQIINNFTN